MITPKSDGPSRRATITVDTTASPVEPAPSSTDQRRSLRLRRGSAIADWVDAVTLPRSGSDRSRSGAAREASYGRGGVWLVNCYLRLPVRCGRKRGPGRQAWRPCPEQISSFQRESQSLKTAFNLIQREDLGSGKRERNSA